MKTPVPEYLLEIRDACSVGDDGELADYIPELASVDPDRFAVSACTLDGVVYTAGDADAEFTIQSMSKPFIYALALRDRGIKSVLEKVGVEPSGDAFNEISLEPETGRPENPMINIGAITTHTLVGPPDATEIERDTAVQEGLSAFAGRPLDVDITVLDSELRTAFRNRAMANLVRAGGIIDGDPDEAVRGYTRQCAYTVTVRDLAVMAVTLAAGGVNPVTKERVVSNEVARHVLAVMATCACTTRPATGCPRSESRPRAGCRVASSVRCPPRSDSGCSPRGWTRTGTASRGCGRSSGCRGTSTCI